MTVTIERTTHERDHALPCLQTPDLGGGLIGTGLLLSLVLAAGPNLPAGPTFHVPSDQQAYVECVADRETHSNPASTNRADGYFGMFQFNEALKDGATWHMLPWLRTWHPHPARFAAQLRAIPMNLWPRNLQIAAMVTTLNRNGKWTGQHHWAGGRYPCTAGAA